MRTRIFSGLTVTIFIAISAPASSAGADQEEYSPSACGKVEEKMKSTETALQPDRKALRSAIDKAFGIMADVDERDIEGELGTIQIERKRLGCVYSSRLDRPAARACAKLTRQRIDLLGWRDAREEELAALGREIGRLQDKTSALTFDLKFQRETLRRCEEARLAREQAAADAGPAQQPALDLSGTWQVGNHVTTLTGGGNSYDYVGTNGHYKHAGTLTSTDGLVFAGYVQDVPGACCGMNGKVEFEVVEEDGGEIVLEVRSKWWKPEQSEPANWQYQGDIWRPVSED